MIDLPDRKPNALIADKAYDTDAIRADLDERDIKAVIPPRSTRIVQIKWDKQLYKLRNQIERAIDHLKMI